ncbi:MAG: hypothetical protein ACHQ1D_03855 [Nitrososphaerales archaeon]
MIFLLDTNADAVVSNIWITIVTILFALSLISERISNLLKLQIKKFRIEPSDEIKKKEKERDIMWLALISGLFVSIVSGADFFTLINEAKLVSIFNIGDPSLPMLRTLMGIFLSGVFISMGSKFWHDILDIVLEFSNLRKYRSREAEEEVKLMNFEIKEKEQIQLLDQAQNIQQKLTKMQGYVGYQVAVSEGSRNKVKMLFNDGEPLDEDKIWLQNYFGEDKIEFEAADIKNTIL